MSADAQGPVAYAAEIADPHAMPPGEAARLVDGAPWRRFAVLGDSLAQGIGEPTPGYLDITWADRVLEALRTSQRGPVYLNVGRQGARVSDVIEHQLQPVLDFRPDLVAAVCGGNDLLAPDFSAEVLHDRLDALFRPLRDIGAEVITYTLQDITTAYPELADIKLQDGISRLNDTVRRVAERHGAYVVEMWGHPAQSEKSIYSTDLIHASRRGHAIVAASTIRTLARMIKQS